MRTSCGLTIRNVEWPMNVSLTWSALSAASLNAAGIAGGRLAATRPGQFSRISGWGRVCDGGASDGCANAIEWKVTDKNAATMTRATRADAPMGDGLTSPTPKVF